MQQKNKPLPTLTEALPGAVRRCRRDTEFLARLTDLYGRLDAAIEREGFGCRACGACCNFDHSGHRLYLSTGELALLTQTRMRRRSHRDGRCPYQFGRLCTAHTHRALGCRVFFCGAPAGRCEEIYETFHHEVRTLHDCRRLPYSYLELSAGIDGLARLFLH